MIRVLIVVLLGFHVDVGFGQGNNCYTPSRESGYCVLLPQCPQLIQMYANQRNRNVINYLVQSKQSCGNRVYNREPIVCCSRPVFDDDGDDYFTTTTQRSVRSNVGEFCLTPDEMVGSCAFLEQCGALLDIYRNNPESQAVTNYLLGSKRSCANTVINRSPIVCCRTSQTTQTTTNRPTTQPTTTTTSTTTPRPTTRTTSTAPWDRFQPPQTTSVCLGPDGRQGNCTNIRECPEMINKLKTSGSSPDFLEYIKSSNGICGYRTQVICCPDEDEFDPLPTTPPRREPPKSNAKLLSVEDGCGFSNFTNRRVVGGEPAPKGSYPWIALLGYTDRIGDISWKCGGTLITVRHIMSAAHCVRNTLTIARMGEHDTESPSADIMDVPIARSTIHPDYDPKKYHNDISILHLAYNIRFSALVRPVCLPVNAPLRTKNFLGYTPFVAGWGRTQEGQPSATLLQHVQITVLDNAVCADRYRKARRIVADNQFDNTVLCAGVLSGGKDSCEGDSGGPLMSPVQLAGVIHWHQIGIVSYGIGCARPDIPGVYTRVQTFIDWILKTIAE